MIMHTLFKALNRFLFLHKFRGQAIKNNLWLVLVVFISTLSFTLLLSPKVPQTVVFSKGQAITSLAKELNEKGVSEGRQRLLVSRFVSVLPKALERYAAEHRVVVLSDKEVVAGAPNITQKVLATIAREMLQQNQGTKPHG